MKSITEIWKAITQTKQCGLMLMMVVLFLPDPILHADDSLSGLSWPGFAGRERSHSVPSGTIPTHPRPRSEWSVAIGDGRAGVVGDANSVYAISRRSNDEPESSIEVVSCLDFESGNIRWQHDYDAGFLKDQQTFGGRIRAPQATPLLMKHPKAGDLLVTIGFSGKLHVFDADTGNVRWSVNLPQRFGATPVAFGYSASPIDVDGQLLVFAGGQRGGLVAFDPANGNVLWNVACGEASYATPVLAEFSGERQVIFVTRNRVMAVTAKGDLLWEKPLPELGLTNVPTPIVLPDGIVMSGQGIQGTTRWKITRGADGQWNIDEEWFSETAFFYCNWGIIDQTILGCDGKLLRIIDLRTGETLGRWRGFADSNVTFSGDQVIIAHDRDRVSMLERTPNGFRSEGSWSITQGRCWTPPTWIKGNSFHRFDDSLHRIDWSGPAEDATNRLASVRIRSKFEIESQPNPKPDLRDALAVISETYESDGAEAAIEQYEKLRRSKTQPLSLMQRKQLVALARGVGANEFADTIPGHAYADLRTEPAKKWLIESTVPVPADQKTATTGDNGLRYLRFAILNLGDTIQAQVKGPAKHPFGYGLPLRTGQMRRERWPIGTVLTDTASGKPLLKVTAEIEGKLFTVPASSDPN